MYSPASGGEIMLQEFVEQVEKTARSVMEEMHTAIPGKSLRSMQEQALLL